MKTQKVTVQAPNGLHARPVGEIVRIVKSFAGTTVSLSTGAKTVSAASILGILSLGLKAGTEVEVSAEGPQEAAAVAALVRIIESADIE